MEFPFLDCKGVQDYRHFPFVSDPKWSNPSSRNEKKIFKKLSLFPFKNGNTRSFFIFSILMASLRSSTQGQGAEAATHRAVSLHQALHAQRLGVVVGGQHGRLVHQDLLHRGDVPGSHQAAAHPLLVSDRVGRRHCLHSAHFPLSISLLKIESSHSPSFPCVTIAVWFTSYFWQGHL